MSFPFDHKHYVCALRAKQGEFKAIQSLTANQREHLTPLWEVQPLDEEIDLAVTPNELDKVLKKIAKNIENAWKGNKAFIETELIDDGVIKTSTGMHPLEFLANELRAVGASPIPVTGPQYSAACHTAAEHVHAAHSSGVCIRLTTLIAADAPAVRLFISRFLEIPEMQLDLIVDLEHVTTETLALVSPFLPATINALAAIHQWRTITLMMGSFPEELGSSGRGHLVFSRPEWLAWRDLLSIATPTPLQRKPAYGDYAIQYPHFAPLPEFAIASANIRYTGESDWHIFRGYAVASIGRVVGHGYGQYHDLADLCRKTIPPYRGSAYSAGDKYIDDCANPHPTVKSGNNSTWRFVGTNQHLVYATNLALSVP